MKEGLWDAVIDSANGPYQWRNIDRVRVRDCTQRKLWDKFTNVVKMFHNYSDMIKESREAECWEYFIIHDNSKIVKITNDQTFLENTATLTNFRSFLFVFFYPICFLYKQVISGFKSAWKNRLDLCPICLAGINFEHRRYYLFAVRQRPKTSRKTNVSLCNRYW